MSKLSNFLGQVASTAIQKISSSNNNSVVRWDGSNGDIIQDSNVVIDDNDIISGMKQKVVSDVSSYTVTESHSGTFRIESSGITITVPADSTEAITPGFSTSHLQNSSNSITFSPESGVTIKSKNGNLKTNGQYTAASLFKESADVWVLLGDLTS